MIHSAHVHSEQSAREQEYLRGWQRALAELDNSRRRQEAESEASRLRVKKEIAQELLMLADNFEAIVSHRPDNLKNNAWADGVLHVARQLQKMLTDFEVKPIEAAGQAFDPIRHDAVGSIKKTKLPSGQVVEVVQAGYTFRGEVLRPAKVKVAA